MNTNGQLVRLAVAPSRNVWAYYAALEVACAGNCFLDLARLRSSESRAVFGGRHRPGNRGGACGFSMSFLFLQRMLVEKQ
jgi:hypothetical protein